VIWLVIFLDAAGSLGLFWHALHARPSNREAAIVVAAMLAVCAVVLIVLAGRHPISRQPQTPSSPGQVVEGGSGESPD
jgi:hypothetical protein